MQIIKESVYMSYVVRYYERISTKGVGRKTLFVGYMKEIKKIGDDVKAVKREDDIPRNKKGLCMSG